jgi:methyl-accepting chemotaxis protein
MAASTSIRRVGRVADAITAPSRVVLGRLRLSAKFALIAVVLLASLGFVAYRYVGAQNASEAFDRSEQAGMVVIPPAFSLEQAVVAARSSAVAGTQMNTDAIRTAMAAVDAADAKVGATVKSADAWKRLKGDLTTLLEAPAVGPQESYDAWSPIVDGVVGVIGAAADGSNLTLDPDLNSFYVMDIATTKSPGLIAALGSALDLAVLPKSDANATALTVANVRIQDAVAGIDVGFGKSIGATSDQAIVTQLTSARAAVADAGATVSDAGGITRLADATKSAAEVAGRALGSFLQTRYDGTAGDANVTLWVSGIAVVLAIWLFVGFYQSVSRGLRRVSAVLAAAARGDLTARVTEITHEEIGEMSTALNTALDSVADALVAVTSRTAAVVGSAASLEDVGGGLQADSARAVFHADSVADLARDLQNDTERTLLEVSAVKDSLHEVNSATESLDEDMQAVSTASTQLNTAVREVARVAEETQRRAALAVLQVAEARDVVVGLTSAADEIGGIVELIEDIAEQTNLLALNATVEAARAGEAGRSFAVVASEVKNLASATTAATERIRESIAAVQVGTSNAAAAITQIVGVIDGISEGQMTVAAAVEEEIAMAVEIDRSVSRQSSGIADIRLSISAINASLDGVKQAAQSVSSTADRAAEAGNDMATTARSNVGAANRTGGAATELASTAAALQAAVSRFTLEQARSNRPTTTDRHTPVGARS